MTFFKKTLHVFRRAESHCRVRHLTDYTPCFQQSWRKYPLILDWSPTAFDAAQARLKLHFYNSFNDYYDLYSNSIFNKKSVSIGCPRSVKHEARTEVAAERSTIIYARLNQQKFVPPGIFNATDGCRGAGNRRSDCWTASFQRTVNGSDAYPYGSALFLQRPCVSFIFAI